jgi:enediyne biosynthesis protein E4
MTIYSDNAMPQKLFLHIVKACILSSFCIVLFSCKRSNSMFVGLSSSQTGIHFNNTLQKQKTFGILYYLYYYNGGGVATGDINNDGLPDIYFTANSKRNNKLYINKGNFQFEDITEKAGVAGTSDWCSGVTMADVNGDGYLDIYVSAINIPGKLKSRNQLYINNGKISGGATFTESAEIYGLDFSGLTTQAAFFDYDHDGDLDCYLLNQSHRPNENIVDTSKRRKFDSNSGDRLYRNNFISPDGQIAEKKFTDVSANAGIYQSSLGYGLGIAVADLNNDGWDDIYIGNDFHENDYYYVNNGDGTFKESGAKHFEHYSRFSMGNDIADYNNDGQPDIVTVDMLPPDEKTLKTYGSDENPDIYKYKLIDHGFQYQYSKNCLQKNNGDGSSFSDIGLLSGISATDWSWAPLFADFDNDGNKDLFISSGIVKRPVDLDYVKFISNLYMQKNVDKTDEYDDEALGKMPDGSSHPFLFKGDGVLNFKDVSNEWGTEKMKGYFNGASYADLDNDGNIDLIVNPLNAAALVLKNQAPPKKYISISFKGDALNTKGVGCKAWIFQNKKTQYQQMMPTRGFQSSSDVRLHFGLDTINHIDSILIVWPDQKYQLIKNIRADSSLIFEQKDAAGVFNYTASFKQPQEIFINKSDSINCNWQHKENNFIDFNVQYLIPHEQSTRGPKIAVGDINGDGLDDFYACGAHSQMPALKLQQKDGSFKYGDTMVFANDKACEDVDAVFFDANGDGKLDLYVVSGGNEAVGNNPFLLDRLYLNNGTGTLIKSPDALPPLFKNKSCVSVADIDNDGDNDIFVGGLADAYAFGIPQTSYLLLNDGKAHFTLAQNSIIDLDKLGIVTTAAFADINKDGWNDLVVAGEWMPVCVFINDKGKFKKTTLNASTGLWQTIYADDVNGDGNIDLLLGNWGWNNKFWSGKNGPLKLYVDDFDRNGRTEQLLSYTKDNIEYPFLAKDEVERPLPLLKKHYLLYTEYAGVPMNEVFYGWIDSIKPLMAERLGSAVCYGDGKGNFSLTDLPEELQLAPVFSFQKISQQLQRESSFILGGNFFDVIPYEGRYDAQPMAVFSIKQNKAARYFAQPNLSEIKGQIRDLKWISINQKKVLLVARNNQPLIFLAYNK